MYNGFHMTLSNFHIRTTTAFKSNLISLRAALPMSEEKHPARILLSYMLAEACQAFPNKRAMQKEVDDLYGGDLSIGIEKIGLSENLRLELCAPDRRFLSEDPLEEQFRFLNALYYHPLFTPQSFEECRTRLLMNRAMALDDPLSDAIDRANRLFNDLPQRTSSPLEEAFQKLTLQDVENSWKEFLSSARMDLTVIGPGDPQRIHSLAETYFHDTLSQLPLTICTRAETRMPKIRRNQKDTIQSALVQMYTTDCDMSDPDMPALMLTNGMLGALPVSLLFQEVREHHSLCYAISSDNHVYEGTLSIEATMAGEHIDPARKLIDRQIERLKTGDFSDEAFLSAKRLYTASWRGSLDSISAQAREEYVASLLKRPDFASETIAAFERVSRQDVMHAARKLKPAAEEILEGVSHD